jgi:hypothetical protein
MARKQMSVESTSMADDVTTKAVTTEASAEALAALAAMFPQGDTFNRAQFPKLTFTSQAKLDDDGETIKIKAGTYAIEQASDEVDEEGKKVWERTELGKTIEGHIIFQRKRLQYWDADANAFVSSPMYDNDNDVIPLFKAGQFMAEGTPAELKAMFPVTKKYKDKKTGEEKEYQGSLLKDASVLYILIGEKLVELTLTGTSRKSWLSYYKSTSVPTTITELSSSKQEVGATKWNQVELKAVRVPSSEEVSLAAQTIAELTEGIQAEKDFYGRKRAESAAGSASAPALAAESAAALPPGEEGEDPNGDF